MNSPELELETLLEALEIFRCPYMSEYSFKYRLLVKIDFYKIVDVYADFDLNLIVNRYLIIDVEDLFTGWVLDRVEWGIDLTSEFINEFALTEKL